MASEIALQPGKADLPWRTQWPQARSDLRGEEQLPMHDEGWMSRTGMAWAPEALIALVQLELSFPGGSFFISRANQG